MANPSITISEIVAEFGAKYIKGGQSVKDLQTKIFQKTETDELFKFYPTEDTVVYKATALITRVLQGFQTDFTPIGDTEFKLQPIQLHHVKIDAFISPDELMPSWLGFLADGKLSRKEWGIVRYWLEGLVVPQMKEDLELNEVFKGVVGTVTKGTPTLSGKSINGIRKTIRDGYAAGKTSMIATGALSTDPEEFVTQIEDWLRQIPEIHRMKMVKVVMSKTLRDRFQQGMRAKYNMQYNQVGSLLKIIDTDTQVVGVASQAGSDMIWTTMEENKANPQKWGGNAGSFDVQGFERIVKALSDWWIGYGFWYLPYVYHNDRDLV